MASPFDQSNTSFSGRAPLFPLPTMTLLPHVLLPLHIFEPRYRRMVADALSGERYLALAQIVPGAETIEPAPIYDHVCLTSVVAEEHLDDGRYYLLVQGVVRSKVLSEEKSDLPYRIARLELRPDLLPAVPTIHRENRRRELLEAFRDLGDRPDLDKLLHEICDPMVPLGQFCDLLASSLNLSAARMQALLAEPNVDVRSDLLLNFLRELRRAARDGGRPRTFPPDFSRN